MAAATGKMKLRQGKLGKKSNKATSDDEEFKLEDVISLGGSKEDYDMLKNVTDETDDYENRKSSKFDKGALKNEIEKMVQSLGLDKMEMESNDDKLVSRMDMKEDSATKKPDRSKKVKIPEVVNVPTNNIKSDDLKQQKVVYFPKFEKKTKILIDPDELWYDQLLSMDDVKIDGDVKSQDVTSIQDVARQYWEDEVALYQEKKDSQKSSDAKWLRTVLSSGTLSDRVAAITMLLQESPVHQVKRLETLLSMAKKKGRREAIMAIDSLRNLWTANLLPDRKLRHFWQWPVTQLQDICKDSGKNVEAKLLILWYFEDLLKAKCAEFVDVLENLSRDTIPGIRDKTAGTMYELLSMKPEQEQKLLTAIVNKLGDPTRKVASRVSYLLGQLVIKHPNMKLVVIQEIERLLYRPNVSSKTQYYAVCFLNQMILTKNESLVASKLISIYFSFFKSRASVDTHETKMLSALLSGVNRAFPYVQDKDDRYDDQLDILFKICHTSSFQTSVQALMLLFQVMQSRRSVTDRYYRALYEKLFDAGINTSTKRTMFLNIIYKSIKADTSLNRVKAFFKRLLQAGSNEEPSFICGLLYLLSEVMKVKSGIKSLTMQPEEDDEDEHFEDVTEGAFTAPNENLVKQHNDEDQAEIKTSNETSDYKSGWTFFSEELKRSKYDIQCRNPLYCGAQFSSAWELHPFLRHYHPSVNRFAQAVLDDKSIEYKGDPLQDFTLVRFLDRFMYKNPKKNPKEHGNSIMQPRKTSDRLKELPVNSKEFSEKKISNVREDEVFFYQYFKRKNEVEEAKKGKKKKPILDQELEIKEDDDEAGLDFDFASEMQKMKDTQPKSKKRRTGNDDDDDDVDEGDDDDDDDSMEGDFDYDDLQFSDDEEFNIDDENDFESSGKKKFSDADYEKALLENLSDSDVNDEMENEDEIGNDKVRSMFAAADEFAHLLEDSGTSKGQQKQANWEARNSNWQSKTKQGRGMQKNTSQIRPGMKRKLANVQRNRNSPQTVAKGKGVAGRKTKLSRKR